VPFRPTSEILLRTGALAVASFAAAAVLNNAAGVSNALVIFLAALVIVDFVLRRTTYGRKVFAVGGGIEAARRAGISVPMVRITVFAISGGFAAVGGMFFAGQTASATLNAGGGNTLMLAIAAAVIGGTSLFGGRGSVWSALLGMLVIQSIQTGLDLLNMNTSIQYMITGAVLLGAVVIDSVSRKSQKAAGRA
jgi:D-xylose transport system permease protein